MLNAIKIGNFKSYKDATLKLAPLTLLVGANASGKSNAIEAIRFLSWLANGRRLDDIIQNVQDTDLKIRGTRHDLTFSTSKNDIVTLGCTLTNTGEWQDFAIEIQLPKQGEMKIIQEQITSPHSKVPLYIIKEPAEGYRHEVKVAFNNFSSGGKKPTIPCTDRQAIFTQLDIPSRFDGTKALEPRKVIPDIVQKLQQALLQITFLDPIPHNMGDYSFIVDKILKEDGSNVSSILYQICETEKRKEDLLAFIRALPEQDIVDVRFLLTPRNEVMVQLVESFGGVEQTRDAPLLSDGTLRTLAVAGALLSAPNGSLIIIEEIDNGIHPSRADMLLSNIQRVADERNLRVLLTSHNPALLDNLPVSAIPHVVACYRDPQEGDSRLVRLEDLTRYPGLVASGPLGDLMANGVLDRYLKTQITEEQEKENALAWFREHIG